MYEEITMASKFVHTERPMRLTTPLGADALVLVGFEGHEGISQLFHYHLDLVSEESTVAFDRLLGQKVSIEWELREGVKRYFHGIVSRFSQAERSFTLTRYSMEVVPQLWLLTRKVRSRIFQHVSVPDILTKVFDGLDVVNQISGSFEPRDYCAQYRESDFAFASRLMEEEGIYYYFQHTQSGHSLVLGNTPQSHPDVSDGDIIYEEAIGGEREEDRVWRWEKTQDLRSGKYTLWDHCFELPGKHLEAEKPVKEDVTLGRTSHKLTAGGNSALEIYDYPGGYAQRFDGIDKSGGECSSEVQKIFTDNGRTVGIRMQAETAEALVIAGAGNCQQLAAGYKFGLDRHFSDAGKYVLTSVDHQCRQPLASDGGQGSEFEYENRFTAIPFGIPYRPQRITPVPVVQGTQTAVVVGPPGEEIFTDKYGRVKVQFHWDRDGMNDANSSCWVRVGSMWAGKRWGMIHIPRIGQEVIVDFLEGHPDQPIIVGSVYNSEQMPPYKLPDYKTKSGIRSNSTANGGRNNCNEIRFEDKIGSEQFFMKAEKDMDVWVQNDCKERIGQDRHVIVERDLKHQVKRHCEMMVTENYKEKIGGDAHLTVTGAQKIAIGGDQNLHVKGGLNEKCDSNLSVTAGGKHQSKAGTVFAIEGGQEVHIKGGMNVVIEAGLQLTIKAGSNFVSIGPAGVAIQGTLVNINSGGAAGSGSGCSPTSPSAPSEPAEPTLADDGLQNVD